MEEKLYIIKDNAVYDDVSKPWKKKLSTATRISRLSSPYSLPKEEGEKR
jgi:hypothetical protein